MNAVDQAAVPAVPAVPAGARPRAGGVRRWRIPLAVALLLGCVALLTFPAWWRGREIALAAALMGWWTGHHTVAFPSVSTIVLYRNSLPQMAFLLSAECSVGFLVAAVLGVAAPLMLVRRLSPQRVIAATVAATVCLLAINVVRVAAIGATVSRWGNAQGLLVGHTYLGSAITFVGTSLTGALFIGILIIGGRPHRDALAERVSGG